jgi:adenylate kinase
MFGPPGSGKGTQAAILSEHLGVPAISTGEMLRDAVRGGSPLGRKVKETMEAGLLVDDETMVGVVRERLARDDAREGFLLDGYPRTVSQAETLASILEAQATRLDAVVLLEVPTEELVRRAIARQREDDREEVVRERLKIYEQKTAPLIAHYEGQGLVRRIDGTRPVDAVTTAVEHALGAG